MQLYRPILFQAFTLSFLRASVTLGVAVFFILAASLFVLAIPQLEMIPVIAPAVIWVCALLASLLAIDSMYQDDFEDGTLEQLLLVGKPLQDIVLAKILAHWCVTGIPLLIASPLLILMFDASFLILIPLILGTIILSMVTSIGASLRLDAIRNRALAGLLILPLYVPVLIFGVHGHLILLIAILFIMAPISVFASRYALAAALKY